MNFFPRSTFFVFAFAFVSATFVALSSPNIVVYFADDQNYWDYGFAGNDKVNTPNIDALAEESMLFNRAYASMAICAPSRSTLYTGLGPLRTGCYMNHLKSRSGVRSVAHYLEPLGYDAVLAGKSHVGPNSVYAWTHYFPSVSGGARDSLPFDRLKKYFAENEQPFCLFLASEFPHGPYPDVPALEEDEFYWPEGSRPHANLKQKAGYYANIKNDDQQLGQVIDLLKRSGKWDTTIFIYAPDHGIDGKYTVSEAGLRVPLLIRYPDGTGNGRTFEALVSLADVIPTIVEWANGSVPEGLDGVSLLPLIEGRASQVRRSTLGVQTWQNVQKAKVFPARSITEERFKLIVNFNALEIHERNFGPNPAANAFMKRGAEAFPKKREFELYDLSLDPFERRNLAYESEYKETLKRLHYDLLEQLRERGGFLVGESPEILLKPTLHPLDETSRWKHVPSELESKLTSDDYIDAHY